MNQLQSVLAKLFAPAQQTIDTAEAKAQQGFAILAGELLIVIILLIVIALRQKR